MSSANLSEDVAALFHKGRLVSAAKLFEAAAGISFDDVYLLLAKAFLDERRKKFNSNTYYRYMFASGKL